MKDSRSYRQAPFAHSLLGSRRNRPARHWNSGIRLALVAFAALALASIVRTNISPARAQTIPSDAQPICTVSAPVFATWFESGSVSANGVVNPANSVTFPNSPNCSFYQWSEQMFLWLTSPAPKTYGGGGGRIFDSPAFYDVSPPDASGDRTFLPHVPGRIRAFNLRAAKVGPHGLPVVIDKRGRMLEVEPPRLGPTGRQLILNSAGKQVEVERVTMGPNRKPIFLDKAGKQIVRPRPLIRPQMMKALTVQKFMIGQFPIFLDPAGNVVDTEEGQADGGVLETQGGSLIYYAMMVNDVYAYFLTGTKDGGITPAPTKFPTTQADLDKITAFASAHGKTFPDPNALAVEIKTAWVETSAVSNPADYITMQATVPTFDKSNPNLWTPNGQKTVQLALVSMHVVGSTAGHPEMIWATFEHFGNAPNAAYSYNSTTGPKTVAQNTSGTWLFCANGASAPFNDVHMHYVSPNIQSVSGHTISPSNIIRWKAWGGAANASPNPLDANTAASNTEIISINNSVRGQLAAGDIRLNYFMTGSTWTIGGAAPTTSFGNPGNTGGNGVGTSQLANTALETYQQTDANFSPFANNCFSCHVNNTTSVSHIFKALKPLF